MAKDGVRDFFFFLRVVSKQDLRFFFTQACDLAIGIISFAKNWWRFDGGGHRNNTLYYRNVEFIDPMYLKSGEGTNSLNGVLPRICHIIDTQCTNLLFLYPGFLQPSHIWFLSLTSSTRIFISFIHSAHTIVHLHPSHCALHRLSLIHQSQLTARYVWDRHPFPSGG